MAMQTASDRRHAAIRKATVGDPTLADAIENDDRCRDCGGYVSGGMSVDPDKCCFFCSPG